MRLNIDSGKLLYALGVLFATAALLYFARDVVFDLSITVKSVLLFLAFVALLVGGVALQRDVLDTVAFALSGVTYVVFVGYVVVRYSPGETGTFLLLALSAGLFVTLGYLVRGGSVAVSQRQALGVVAALVLVSTVLVGVDAVGGDVSYGFETESPVTVEPVTTDRPTDYSERQKRIGTLTASNGFVFTRALSLPSLSGCLVGVDDVPGERVWVDYDRSGYGRPDTIAGGATRAFGVEASIPIGTNTTESVTYDIERGSDCDADRDSPTLIVTVGGENGRID